MGASAVLGGPTSYPVKSQLRDSILIRCNVNIGATGAPTLISPPGWTIVRNSAGNYSITFPAVPAQANSIPVLRGGILKSAASTVSKIVITAFSETAGTATFVTALTSATAVDPANGDILWLEFEATATKVP